MKGSVILSEKKKEGVFSAPIVKLLNDYSRLSSFKKDDSLTKIHVDEIASKVARFYERIRKIVDWKEENLLQRNAIERILKRSLFGEFSKFNFLFKNNVDNIAESLVLELIRGGHLPNGEVPQNKIPVVQKIINKYVFLIKNGLANKVETSLQLKKKVNFYEWVLEIAACEIEETLSPRYKENLLIEAMTELMNERIKVVSEKKISEEEKKLQVYIAVHQTLFDLDEAIVSYRILKYKYPFWVDLSPERLGEISDNIFKIWKYVQEELHHPLSREFFNLCEKTDTVFVLLGDLLDEFKNRSEELLSVVEEKQKLDGMITQFYNIRVATLKKRLFKLAVFSTLSVFVANWFTFFVVEVPLAHLFYSGFNLLAALVDLLLPSVVMFLLVSLIKPPSLSNLDKVIDLTNQFVFTDQGKENFEIGTRKRKKPFTIFTISLIYILVCCGTFYLIARLFYLAQIPFSSVVLDTIGIALNVFAALVIRNKSKELTVEDKSTFWEFILDIISLPIAEIGSWIASKWREYNVVSVFFNVIIETPFVNFIEFVENWRDFLKEKKGEIH